LKLAQAKFEPLAGKIPSPKGLVEYLKVFKLSSNPSATKKKKESKKRKRRKRARVWQESLFWGTKRDKK
jgi:hypothetical protein